VTLKRRVLGLVALLALAVPSPVAAATSSASVRLTGTLRVAIADDFAGARSQTFVTLATDTGSVPLSVSGDVSRFQGARVELSGTKLGDGRVAVEAASIVVDTPAPAPARTSPARPPARAQPDLRPPRSIRPWPW
jgi:hypothetical protein